MRGPGRALALVAAVAALIFVACTGGSAEIDFSLREDPTPSAEPSEPPDGVVRIAIASVLSPLPTSNLYQELAVYLQEKLDRPVELVQGKTYAEINDLVKSGDVAMALVCTNPYLQGNEDFGMELLAMPQANGATVYYSFLIAGAGVDAASLEDLRGATFAFTDPLSNSGRLAPVYQLALTGETPDSFFSRSIFTYAHDSSVLAVAEGVVDAAAVDSLVFEYMLAEDPTLAGRVNVIERWGPYGINPIVVNPRLDPEMKGLLRDMLLGMDEDPAGRQVLKDIRIDRFITPDDSIYDSVREMRSYLRERGLGP